MTPERIALLERVELSFVLGLLIILCVWMLKRNAK